MERVIHQERNAKRFREMLGIKQEALTIELGEDWNQKKVSMLEGKGEVEAASCFLNPGKGCKDRCFRKNGK